MQKVRKFHDEIINLAIHHLSLINNAYVSYVHLDLLYDLVYNHIDYKDKQTPHVFYVHVVSNFFFFLYIYTDHMSKRYHCVCYLNGVSDLSS